MDTVILAAGRGDRLSGITPPFHKPLLVINGQPLVKQAVERGVQAAAGYVTVVVAPENAAPISAVLGDRNVRMVVQRTPTGPGNALCLGLLLCRPGRVLVLMGDNITSFDDIKRCVDAGGYSIGVQAVTAEEALRFTWRDQHGAWREKEAPTDADADPGSGMFTAWVGPLVIDRDAALTVYRDYYASDIGPHLNDLRPDTASVTLVPVSTLDIGVPEAL